MSDNEEERSGRVRTEGGTLSQTAASRSALPERMPEQVLFPEVTDEQPGRYTLLGEHGRGGQSRVWLAHDRHIGREVAFKQLLPERLARAGSGARERFLREARITGQLEHPSIVPVYEIGVRGDGSLYSTQKLVRGGTLAEALAAARGLEDRLKLLPHFAQLCQAMAYAHSRGVIHRDLKPHNVMVGEFGETIVLDWGLAKVRGGAEDLDLGPGPTPGRADLTVEGEALGTPSYMSPEQALGQLDRVDERSDVWSLGAILHELLTGHPPFEGSSAVEVIHRVGTELVRPVRALSPQAPRELCAVAERALQRRPEDRYASARTLADEVLAFREGRRVAAYDYSSWELLRRVVVRNKALSVVSAAALVLLLLGAAMLGQSYRRSQAYLLEARGNLGRAFLEKARQAEDDADCASAAAWYAAARVQEDSLAARGGAAVNRHCEARLALTLSGHDGGVMAVAFSPDGGVLASVGWDQTVRFWDPDTGQERRRIQVPSQLRTLAFSPDGRTLATAGLDGVVYLHDVASGAPRGTLDGHRGRIWSIAFSPRGDRLAASGANRTLTLWELSTGRPTVLLTNPPPAPGDLVPELDRGPFVFVVAFSPDGRWLAGGGGHLLLLWDLSTPGLPPRSFADNGVIYGLAFSPDSAALAIGGDARSLSTWDVSTGSQRWSFPAKHGDQILTVAWSRDGSLLASGGEDRSVCVWDARSRARLACLRGHRQNVNAVAFSPDGGLLASAGADRSIRLWRLTPGRGQRFLDGRSALLCLAYAPDGGLLAAGDVEGRVSVWDAATGRPWPQLVGHRAPLRGVAFSPDGARLASGSDDRTVRVWNSRSGELLALLRGHTGPTRVVAFTTDGRLLASASTDGTVRLWDTASWELSRELRHPAQVLALAFSPDGRWMATGGVDRAVHLWDTATWRETVSHVQPDTVSALAFSPDGRGLAVGTQDSSVRIWDVERGVPMGWSRQHEGSVQMLAFSPDGRWLASVSRDRTMRLWDSATGEERLRLRRHDREVYGVAFSVDGRTLASASWDGTVRLTDVTGLEELPPPEEHLAAVLTEHQLVLEGMELRAGSPGGTIHQE